MKDATVMMPPAISDRDGFFALLTQAIGETEQLCALDRTWALPGDILKQLSMMRAAVDAHATPERRVQDAISIGPLAALNFEGKHDSYAHLLKQLHYAFRRFDLLADRLPAADLASWTDGEATTVARRGIVQVYLGPDAVRKVALNVGDKVVIGSSDRSQLILAKDKMLGGRHLEVSWDGIVLQVRDLAGPGGLQLNGVAALRGELKNGGVIEAGSSVLRFFVEAHTPAPIEEGAASAGVPAGVIEKLRDDWIAGRLYGVVDAAQSPRALQLLNESVDEHRSLYEGPEGRALDRAAPYLVRFRPDSGLLSRWLREGFGRAWGILLTSKESRKMIRRSLRRLLMVEADTREGRLYFRFYDPRVLARFAPLVTPRQLSEMLAAAEAIHYEQGGQLLSLRAEAT